MYVLVGVHGAAGQSRYWTRGSLWLNQKANPQQVQSVKTSRVSQ